MTEYDRNQARFIRMYKHGVKVNSLDNFKKWERDFYNEVIEMKNTYNSDTSVYLIGKNRVTIVFGFIANIDGREFLYAVTKRNNDKKEVNIISMEGSMEGEK